VSDVVSPADYRQLDCSAHLVPNSPALQLVQISPRSPSEKEVVRLLSAVHHNPCDDSRRASSASGSRFTADYVVDSDLVAEALLAKIEELADERARYRRSLIYSVEMIEAPDVDVTAARIE
jgi:hypothetical protein